MPFFSICAFVLERPTFAKRGRWRVWCLVAVAYFSPVVQIASKSAAQRERSRSFGGYMLIGHENFFHSLLGERSVWIKGQLGSYKTALTYRLAYELLTDKDYGYRHIVSNLPDVWSDPLDKVS